MARRKKATITVKVKSPKRRCGHYNFQGAKATFDPRPRKLRTRSAVANREIKDYS